MAEHGFSALITITTDERSRRILFDFGSSEHEAAFNADALDVDLAGVETIVLSSGQIDHLGGLEQLVERVDRKGIELVLHPSAFKHPRYMKLNKKLKAYFPSFTREKAQDMGITLLETKDPYPLLGGFLL